MIRNWIRPLFVVGALSLCFFYIWGCSFGSSSSGTVSNPLGPTSAATTNLEAERIPIANQLAAFSDACKGNNISGAVQLIEPAYRETYQDIFQKNPEAMRLLGNTLGNADLVFLNKNATTESGYAEVSIATNGLVFSVGLAKVDGVWLLKRP